MGTQPGGTTVFLYRYITIAVSIRRQTILQFWIALTEIIGVYRMVATVYLYAVKLSLYCLTEFLGRPEVYATKPNVISRYGLVLGHCTQELRLDVEAFQQESLLAYGRR